MLRSGSKACPGKDQRKNNLLVQVLGGKKFKWVSGVGWVPGLIKIPRNGKDWEPQVPEVGTRPGKCQTTKTQETGSRQGIRGAGSRHGAGSYRVPGDGMTPGDHEPGRYRESVLAPEKQCIGKHSHPGSWDNVRDTGTYLGTGKQ
ncbi:hypothetical protein L6452_32339 [Arctium lappa]|uniref:Uncharacterized protein n=1 Tax=Arctium lappa TaxID=4217 RepID=A0ACB8Z425_ARCLA|nr:hypothetical protein L6452_32339 [Arctium lappa]